MISKRSRKIKSFIAMDVLEASQRLERQGRSIIHFSLGEPDFAAPKSVEDACIRAIRRHQTKYTHSQGSIALREAISKYYKSHYGVRVDPERVIVTQGTSPAFFLIFSTLLEKGDEVILPNPHYPCDANFVEFLGGKPVFFPVQQGSGYQWDIEAVKKRLTRKTRAVFVTSPSNPTGTVLNEKVLRGLSKLKVPIVSDEIYHGLIYDGDERTMLEFSDDCFVVNGFSKAYAMTGFRLGYVIAPQKYIEPMRKIQQNFYISANSFVQEAGLAALTRAQKDVVRMRGEFKKRRDVMLKGLNAIGLKVEYVPEGAFYVFVNVRHLTRDSYKLAFDILEKAGVAVTPGIDFGSEGEGYLRFSYATSIANIREGLRRLKSYFEKRAQ